MWNNNMISNKKGTIYNFNPVKGFDYVFLVFAHIYSKHIIVDGKLP